MEYSNQLNFLVNITKTFQQCITKLITNIRVTKTKHNLFGVMELQSNQFVEVHVPEYDSS